MPQTKTTSKRQAPRPQEAYGPRGELVATSADAGRTWIPTEAGRRLSERPGQQPRAFTRRIAAVADNRDASFMRRIELPFSCLHEIDCLAGWAPFADLAALGDHDLDAVVIPNPILDREQMREMKRVGRTLLLDLEAPMGLDERGQRNLKEAFGMVDAILVPNAVLATRLRTYHERVFVAGHLIAPEPWRDVRRQSYPKPNPLRIGVGGEAGPALQAAIDHIAARMGDRVAFEAFNPMAVEPLREPETYARYDVVVLPTLPDRAQASMAPILPAMAAECLIVADRWWPLVKHDTTGIYAGRDTAQHWINALHKAIMDSRSRMRLARNARVEARRHTPMNQLATVALPYRLAVPESAPVSYAAAS